MFGAVLVSVTTATSRIVLFAISIVLIMAAFRMTRPERNLTKRLVIAVISIAIYVLIALIGFSLSEGKFWIPLVRPMAAVMLYVFWISWRVRKNQDLARRRMVRVSLCH
jgi:CHASE2 domain-containing sensor protein